MIDLPEIREGVVVHPGEILVVRLDRSTPTEDVRDFAERIRDYATLNGFEILVVVAEQIGVIRAGDQP